MTSPVVRLHADSIKSESLSLRRMNGFCRVGGVAALAERVLNSRSFSNVSVGSTCVLVWTSLLSGEFQPRRCARLKC